VKTTFPICFGLIRSYSKLLFHFLFVFEIFVFSKKKGRSRDHFGHGVTKIGHGVTNWSRQRPTTEAKRSEQFFKIAKNCEKLRNCEKNF
jgi:hypothetical protein